MDIKRMHDMIEMLSECAKKQFDRGIDCVDAEEMCKVIDMMKDLSEAMYYRTITVAMDGAEYGVDYDWRGKNEGATVVPNVHHDKSKYETAKHNYEQSKTMHTENTAEEKQHKMRLLEEYMKELNVDLTNMISDMSQEEKMLLKNKMQVLMQKIQ